MQIRYVQERMLLAKYVVEISFCSVLLSHCIIFECAAYNELAATSGNGLFILVHQRCTCHVCFGSCPLRLRSTHLILIWLKVINRHIAHKQRIFVAKTCSNWIPWHFVWSQFCNRSNWFISCILVEKYCPVFPHTQRHNKWHQSQEM